MRIEAPFEERVMEFSAENPVLRKARFCKAIAPIQGTKEVGGHFYSDLFPRIVKTKFIVPPNWRVVQEFSDGEPFTYDTLDERGKPIRLSVTDRRGVLVHTCTKPYQECFEGFWGRWRED